MRLITGETEAKVDGAAGRFVVEHVLVLLVRCVFQARGHGDRVVSAVNEVGARGEVEANVRRQCHERIRKFYREILVGAFADIRRGCGEGADTTTRVAEVRGTRV